MCSTPHLHGLSAFCARLQTGSQRGSQFSGQAACSCTPLLIRCCHRYNCNRFDEKDAKDAQDAASDSRRSLERYLFYFDRYANHANSIQLESKLEAMVEKKMQEIQLSASMSWIEVQFLSRALKTLRECRTALMNTYVFAFFLKKNNEAEIFESNQKDLEMACEALSGYLEGEAASQEAAELKVQVQDKAHYCGQRWVLHMFCDPSWSTSLGGQLHAPRSRFVASSKLTTRA